jgi:hypothetical protein
LPGEVDFGLNLLRITSNLNYPFAPNIIRFATNFFTNGRQSSAVSAAARPVLISGRSLENSRTNPSVQRLRGVDEQHDLRHRRLPVEELKVDGLLYIL